MLAAYCRHACRYQRLSRQVDALDATDDLKTYEALARTAEREFRAMLAHARALRLTLQARIEAGTAARRTRNKPSTYEQME